MPLGKGSCSGGMDWGMEDGGWGVGGGGGLGLHVALLASDLVL